MRVMLACMGAENLGVGYLSASLRARGHQTEILYDPGLFDDKRFLHLPRLREWCDATELLLAQAAAFGPDLIGLSVMSCSVSWARRLASRLKDRFPVPLVVGGIHPTLAPESLLAHPAIDYALLGESEEALAELADALAAGRDPRGLRNLAWRDGARVTINPLRPLVQDLDALPVPDKHGFLGWTDAAEKYRIIVSRGCPYRCSFCSHSRLRALYGPAGYVRFRSPENVIAELLHARQDGRVKIVKFMDDIFTLDREWLARFLPRYRDRIGLPFECIVHPAHLDDERAGWLREAGCALVDLGIQSVNAKAREDVLLRPERNDTINNAVRACESHRLRYTVDYLFGVPGVGESDHRLVATWLIPARALVRITGYWLTLFPSCELVEIVRRRGALTPERAAALAHGEEVIYLHEEAGFDVRAREIDRRWRRFFLLLPALPVPLRRWFLAGNRIRWFDRVPDGLVTVLTLVVSLLRRENVPWYYLRDYLRNGAHLLRFRLFGTHR